MTLDPTRRAAPTTTSSVLVVDDEDQIRELVRAALRYEGYKVVTAATGRDALSAAARDRIDLVVLDVMLPDVDGFEVQQLLRRRGDDVPVLFLSARDQVEDRVHGLTTGGDDYLAKPFSIDELIARIGAILRRSGSSPASPVLRFADLELDESLHEVRRDGERIAVTPTEYKLLRYFLMNPRQVLSKTQIIDHVWNYDFDGDMSIVESYISTLRRKIDRGRVPLLHTVRSAGYLLRVDEH